MLSLKCVLIKSHFAQGSKVFSQVGVRWDQALLVPTYVNSSLDLAEFGGSSTNLVGRNASVEPARSRRYLLPSYYHKYRLKRIQLRTQQYHAARSL